MLVLLRFAPFLGDSAQNLIIALWNLFSWLVNLPVAWDGIQLLVGLSFFGWLTFGALNSDEIRSIKNVEKKRKARTNLHKIGGGFIVSFVFFLLCGAADYLLHNQFHMGTLLTSFGIIPSQTLAYQLTAVVMLTGVFGLVMLFYPMIEIRRIEEREDGLVNARPPSLRALFFTANPMMGTTLILLLSLPHLYSLLPAGMLVLLSVPFSYLGSYLNWRYWSKDDFRWPYLATYVLECSTLILYALVTSLHLGLATQTQIVVYTVHVISNGRTTVTTTVSTTTV